MDFIINSSFIRELDLNKLLRYFADYEYLSDAMIEDDLAMKDAVEDLCDWDRTGNDGLALYCGHFESIKREDMDYLIQYIRDNIESIKERIKENGSSIREEFKRNKLDNDALKIRNRKEYYNSDKYKARDDSRKTIYKGRVYDSRVQCMTQEGITKAELYKYLVEQNPDKFPALRKKYKL